MLNLTSYERMRRYLSLEGDTLLIDSVSLKREINTWIQSVSRAIQQYLGYDIEKKEYTEYFDVKYNQAEYWTSARPVLSLGAVQEDFDGLFDGGESDIDDCFIGLDGNSICLPEALALTSKKGLRATYTAGMAISGTDSNFTLANGSTTFSSGGFVSSTYAMGIVKAWNDDSLTLENLFGVFEAGDVLTEYTDENMSITSTGSGTIASIDAQSLAESYPDIVAAAEMQIRFMYKHKHDFELTTTNRDSTNIRREYIKGDLTPEARLMLQPYIRPSSL